MGAFGSCNIMWSGVQISFCYNYRTFINKKHLTFIILKTVHEIITHHILLFKSLFDVLFKSLFDVLFILTNNL